MPLHNHSRPGMKILGTRTSGSARRRAVLFAVASLAAFAIPTSAAWADEIVNNIDGTRDSALESLTLTVPTNGATTITVHPITGDGDPGCNFEPGGGIAKFGVASSDTAVATVSPADFTFDACADTQTVTVTPVSAGTATVTFSVITETTAGTWSTLPANFTVSVANAPPPPPPANHAPTVSSAAADANGNEGDTLTTSGAFADEDGDSLTITKDSGAGTVTPGSGGSWSWSLATSDDTSGTVVVKADDGKGGTVTDSFSYTAVNVAPVMSALAVTGNNTTACLAGNLVGVSFTVTDPATEAADPITGLITWGGGAPATTSISGRSVSESHTYPPGSFTLSAGVNDGDGGADSDTAAISHLYSTTGGFPLPPINVDGTSNFKLGSTIPVKLRVADCNGTSVAGLSPRVSLVKTTSSTSGTVNEDVTTVSVPDDGNLMRFDSTAGQYIYNLSTKRSAFAPGGGELTLGHYKLTVSGDLFASRSIEFDILR
jgi:hypothetical protein